MEREKKIDSCKESIVDLKSGRIRKRVLNETDPDCGEEVSDFLDKFVSDTLTGL